MARTHGNVGSGHLSLGVCAADGLVALAGVEGELAEDLAGGAVEDGDVEVVDQEQDAGSGVGPADADGVEAAAVAQGDLAAGVDAVGADAVVGVVGASRR